MLEKIKDALVWLKDNNPLYSDIELNIADRDELVDPESSSVRQQMNIFNSSSSVEECAFISVNPSSNCVVGQLPSGNRIDIAPNENSPVNILNIANGEEMAFPWLFPYGTNGFNVEREMKLSPSMYFRSRLYNAD